MKKLYLLLAFIALTLPIQAQDKQAENYNYAYSMMVSENSSSIAPVKVYDDGSYTYFTFSSTIQPEIFVFRGAGSSLVPQFYREHEGIIKIHSNDGITWIADLTAKYFLIKLDDKIVTVINEK